MIPNSSVISKNITNFNCFSNIFKAKELMNYQQLPTTLLQKHCEIILNFQVISKNITTIDYFSDTFKVKELKEKYLKRKCQWEYQK